jgi:hypothetical protein
MRGMVSPLGRVKQEFGRRLVVVARVVLEFIPAENRAANKNAGSVGSGNRLIQFGQTLISAIETLRDGA